MENYEIPEIEVIRFAVEDVIATSNFIDPELGPDELPIVRPN